MKVERYGIDRVEHWISPSLPSVITIPIERDGKKFVIYISSLSSDVELRKVAKEIADRLELEPATAGC